MNENDLAEARDRMSLRCRLVGQLGDRVNQSPESQLEYMEDMQKLLSGQAKDAGRTAAFLREQSPKEADMMEQYADAMVAANDAGQDWTIVRRAMRDELPDQALHALEADPRMKITREASREAALLSWTAKAEPQQVTRALDRYWQAHERQEAYCTIDLGEAGKKYDRARLVSTAWASVSADSDLSSRARTRFEQNSALMDDPDSVSAKLAGQMMKVDRSTGVTQTKLWTAHMGREQGSVSGPKGPSLDMMNGQGVTGPDSEAGLDR